MGTQGVSQCFGCGVVGEGEEDIDDGNFYCFACWLIYHAARARLWPDHAHGVNEIAKAWKQRFKTRISGALTVRVGKVDSLLPPRRLRFLPRRPLAKSSGPISPDGFGNCMKVSPENLLVLRTRT